MIRTLLLLRDGSLEEVLNWRRGVADNENLAPKFVRQALNPKQPPLYPINESLGTPSLMASLFNAP